jgi:hypothetical protein
MEERKMKDKDKVEILGSPLGMYSLLRDPFIISILNDDGSLNTNALSNLVAKIANMGANALRDFFWIDSEDAYRKISPFWREGGTVKWNDRYFEHQRKIAKACNDVNMRYYLSIFDDCGTKKIGDFNPWRSFDTFFYEDDAKEVRHQFIDRILAAFEGDLDTGIELCNEPRAGMGLFLADTFLYLHSKGYSERKIILGIDYHFKEKEFQSFAGDYKAMRVEIVKKMGNDERWEGWLKSRCISPMHQANLENIKHLWTKDGKIEVKDIPKGGTRRVLYSMDGVRNFKRNGQKIEHRPDKEYMRLIAKTVLETKSEARENDKILFEVVYGKDKHEPGDSILGVAEAYKDIWNEDPKNLGKFGGDGPVIEDDSGGSGEQPEPVTTRNFQAIVERGFRGILGRDADSGGKEAYINEFKKGMTLLKFCKSLVDSNEYKNNRASLRPRELAEGFYQGILGRPGDEPGLVHTIQAIEKGHAAEHTAAMLDSQEFKDNFG